MTKYEKMRALLQDAVFWSGGSDRPWEGDALTNPWLVDRLAFLSAFAPDHLIDQLAKELAE